MNRNTTPRRPESEPPPKLATRLLAHLLPEEDRAAVLGDFEELWGRDERHPPGLRRLKFWAHVAGVGFGFSWYRLVRLLTSGRRRGSPSPSPSSPILRGSDRGSLMTAWIQDTRIAIRTLRKQPLFTATVVLTLALGIGATTSVFSTADALLFRPLPFPEPDELLYVPLVVPAYGGRSELEVEWSYPKVRLLMESTNVFEGSTTYQAGSRILTGADDPEEVRVESVGSGYFDLLGVEMVVGRAFQPEEDLTGERPFVAILSHDLWIRRYGGDLEVLGRTIRLDGQAHSIVGVARAGFPGLSGSADLWVPVMTQGASLLNNPDNHAHELFVRLRDGVSLTQAQNQLRAFPRLLAEAYPPANPSLPILGIRARPLRELRSDPSTRQAVLFLLGAVGAVLVIACSNLANLLLVRARRRRTEMAVRAALGAGRSRILRQLMTESLLLAAVGGALGTAFAAVWTPLLRITGLRTQEVFRQMDVGLTALGFSEVALDGRVLLFSAGLCLVVAVVFGLTPAFNASRTDLACGLKGGPRGGRWRRRIRLRGRSLVVTCQVALALALLTCSGLLLGSLTSLVRSDVGIRSENVLTARISLPQARYDSEGAKTFWAELLERVSTLPGIRSSGVNYCPPLSDRCTGTFIWFPDRPAPPDGIRPMPEFHMVAGDYFGTLGIPLQQGRLLGPEDREGMPLAVVVGESAANAFWPGESPLGKVITLQRAGLGDATVVGVVGDVSYGSIEAGPRPAIYASRNQVPSRTGYLALKGVRGRSSSSLLPALRAVLAELDAKLPLTDVRSMSERLADATSPTRFTAIVLSLFAGAGLTLSIMGLFGVLALMAGERMHEFGMRRVLGAGQRDLVGLILKHSGRMIGFGLALGASLSWVSTRLLENLLFGLRPHDPRAMLGAAALLSLSALLASLLPALRAAKVDPLVAVQQD